MKKCPVDEKDLHPTYTKQGVEIDSCPHCGGIWLDKDEIYHFTRMPTYLKTKLVEAIANQMPSKRKSPISGQDMIELALFDNDVQIEYCLQSGGIWLDKNEIEKFPVDKCLIEIDSGVTNVEKEVDLSQSSQPNEPAVNLSQVTGLIALPNLYLSSASVLFGMYAILTFFLILIVQLTDLTPLMALVIGLVVAVVQFLLGPFLMDLTLRWLYRVRWVEPQELPVHLKNFIAQVCQKEKIHVPRMGIIDDGSPQAFTYGHHPNNGRIVISRGLMDLLQKEELESVVAHEIGHIVHWDMLVMTAAQLVPLVLYYIYRTLIRMRSRGRDKSAPARYLIAIGAYILYVISEYIVLWFSRIREYYADRYSGATTGHPEKLASALIKIGYGLAGRKPDETKKDRGQSDAVGLQPLGIFDSKCANMLAIAGVSGPQRMGEEIDPQALKDVAKWDLWNPWASYYELHSTHPLIAKRLKMLSNLSRSIGKEPYIEFNEQKPESYWDDFFMDVFIYLLPSIIFIGGLAYYLAEWTKQKDIFILPTQTNQLAFLPLIVILFGICYLGKIFYSYASEDFAPMNIRALLKKIRVSAVHPVPCVVKGKIIGRGVPGLLFSEDFVLQDETGIIFLDYQQPLAFINFFFGLLRAAKYQNQDVEVVGWYRRAPVPYIEIKELRIDDKVSVCYTYHAKIVLSVLLIALGIFLFFSIK